MAADKIEALLQRTLYYLFNSKVWKDASVIAIFVSYKDEFSTREIIEAAWKQNRKVITPKVINLKERKMVFVPLCNWQELQEGFKGIPEPVSDEEVCINSDVLMLMPGLAFDRQGWRLGYGGGFYDTYLSSLSSRPLTLGLGYSSQIVSRVPHDNFDVPIDGICSDTGLEWIKNDSV